MFVSGLWNCKYNEYSSLLALGNYSLQHLSNLVHKLCKHLEYTIYSLYLIMKFIIKNKLFVYSYKALILMLKLKYGSI